MMQRIIPLSLDGRGIKGEGETRPFSSLRTRSAIQMGDTATPSFPAEAGIHSADWPVILDLIQYPQGGDISVPGGRHSPRKRESTGRWA